MIFIVQKQWEVFLGFGGVDYPIIQYINMQIE